VGDLLALRPERLAQVDATNGVTSATRREAGAHWVLTAGPAMYLTTDGGFVQEGIGRCGFGLSFTTRRDTVMGAHENKQTAQAAYEAFGKGDAEAAMRNIDESVEWTVRGDNALTGTYNGKQAVTGLWGEFASKNFRTEPHDFIADGDKVVVLTTVHLEGETVESADILTYSDGGRLVAFDTRADAQLVDRVFAK
jgi:uncharacterized protein